MSIASIIERQVAGRTSQQHFHARFRQIWNDFVKAGRSELWLKVLIRIACTPSGHKLFAVVGVRVKSVTGKTQEAESGSAGWARRNGIPNTRMMAPAASMPPRSPKNLT
jgi:hypothetical protein